MAGSTVPQQPTEANLPEKPVPAQVNNAMPHHHNNSNSNSNSNNRYTLQPAHFQPLDAPKPEPFRSTKSFSVGKLILGCSNFVFAVIVLGLSIGIINLESYDAVLVIITGAMGLLSLLWQVAEFITIAVRGSIRRPIHPGAHVGLHLCFWILALFVTITCCFTLSYSLDSFTVSSGCDNYDSGSSSSSSSDDNFVYCDYYTFSSDAAARTYFGMLEALTAFSLLMLLCHFALFVMACIETDRRRKWDKQAKVVYLVATSGPVDGRTYYTQVPAPVQQQQQQQSAAMQQHPAMQQRTMGPSQEMYGYFAPPAPSAAAAAAAAAAAPRSKPAKEQADAEEVTAGPSTASYA